MPRILVVEDDPSIRRGLEMNLQLEGFDTVAAEDGRQALDALDGVDLVILDIMLPHLNGYQVCQRLRADGHDMPVILLSAKSAELDIVRGLELGADDYVTKPFRLAELLARVKAHLRRRAPMDGYRFGDVEIEFDARLVKREGQMVELTEREYDLLVFLIEREGKAVTRDAILNGVWGSGYFGTDRTVDNFITRLRQKLDTPGNPDFFHTVRGVGYRFLAGNGSELHHPGCNELAWDGSLLAMGLGHLWRLEPAGWTPEPPRPLHAVHLLGVPRAVEVHGDTVYTHGSRGWRATARVAGDEVLAHPSGAIAFARNGVVHRACRPGRTPTHITELRADSLRFGPSGTELFGLGVDGPVEVELSQGRARPLDGVPLGAGVVWRDGTVHRGDEVVATGLREASPAVGPTHIAGPGGKLWDLATLTPSRESPIALGATAPVGEGFVTLPYEGSEAWWVAPGGVVRATFPVGLAVEDVVTALAVEDGVVWAETAYGQRLRLGSVGVDSRGEGSDRIGPVTTPWGVLDAALQVRHDGRTIVAAEAGWLLSWL